LKVVLSGLGGDELLAGYRLFADIPRHLALTRGTARFPALGRAARRASELAWRLAGKPKAAGIIEYGSDTASAYMLHRCLFMPWELHGMVDGEILDEGMASLDTLARLRREIDGIRSPTLQIAALEIGNYMRDQLLRDSDWASMAHSLELRVPLVDVPLFRRVLELRASGIDCSKAAACKSASADALKLIAGRRKTGFGIPISSWMHHLGIPPRVSGHPMRAWAIMVGNRGFANR
jgi:asparagine synthase (glutamine-hydrolysing)